MIDYTLISAGILLFLSGMAQEYWRQKYKQAQKEIDKLSVSTTIHLDGNQFKEVQKDIQNAFDKVKHKDVTDWE